jgi:hypothetical protein
VIDMCVEDKIRLDVYEFVMGVNFRHPIRRYAYQFTISNSHYVWSSYTHIHTPLHESQLQHSAFDLRWTGLSEEAYRINLSDLV